MTKTVSLTFMDLKICVASPSTCTIVSLPSFRSIKPLMCKYLSRRISNRLRLRYDGFFSAHVVRPKSCKKQRCSARNLFFEIHDGILLPRGKQDWCLLAIITKGMSPIVNEVLVFLLRQVEERINRHNCGAHVLLDYGENILFSLMCTLLASRAHG